MGVLKGDKVFHRINYVDLKPDSEKESGFLFFCRFNSYP